MTYDFQIVIDAADPHAQADWWAQTLGWQVEPSNEEFIRAMVAQGHAQESDTTTHNGVLVWRSGQAIRHPEDGRRILFNLVPEGNLAEPATGPSAPTRKHNRLHLDIRVGDEDRHDVVANLIARGAAKLWDGHQGPYRWVTMVDPEGNEFCVA
jgi:hypothetical protein